MKSLNEATTASAENSQNQTSVSAQKTQTETTVAAEKVQDAISANAQTATGAFSEKSEVTVDWSKSPEEMTVEELQAGILAKMANNGPVTDQMKKTVYDNIWHDSLVNWLKSFR